MQFRRPDRLLSTMDCHPSGFNSTNDRRRPRPPANTRRHLYRERYQAFRESIWGSSLHSPASEGHPPAADPGSPGPVHAEWLRIEALRAQVRAVLQDAAGRVDDPRPPVATDGSSRDAGAGAGEMAAAGDGPGFNDDLARFYRSALEVERIAARHAFEPELAELSLRIGQRLAAAGLQERAGPRLHAAFEMFHLLGTEASMLQALEALVDCHGAGGQPEPMLECLGKARAAFGPGDTRCLPTRFHAVLVDAQAHHAAHLMRHGEGSEALAECERMLASLPPRFRVDLAADAAQGDARLLDALARLHLLRGLPELSGRCAAALLRGSRAQRRTARFANGCRRAAEVRQAQGRPVEAARWLHRALARCSQPAADDRRLDLLAALTDLYAANDRPVEELEAIKAARRIEARRQPVLSQLNAELTAIEHQVEDSRTEPGALAHAHRLVGLGRMVASLAHEVTQPLSAIRLIAENAGFAGSGPASGGVPPDADASPAGFGRIVELVDQLSTYLHRLKRFARGEPADLHPTALSQIVGEALAICEAKQKSCGVRLVVDVDDAVVLVDPKGSVGVVVNLLCNAFDAVAGKPSPEVRLTGRRVLDRGILQVRDFGDGMSVQTLACLYRPFYSTKPSGEGLGLGLALAMNVTRQMGARLDGANHPDGGAQFTFDLAIAPPAPAPAPAAAMAWSLLTSSP